MKRIGHELERMSGKPSLARAEWDVLFGMCCLAAATFIGTARQQPLLVVLGGVTVVEPYLALSRHDHAAARFADAGTAALQVPTAEPRGEPDA